MEGDTWEVTRGSAARCGGRAIVRAGSHQTAIRPQSDGNQTAIRPQSDGNQTAIRRQSDGNLAMISDGNQRTSIA